MIILFSIVFVRFSHVRFFLFYLDSSVAENFRPSFLFSVLPLESLDLKFVQF